MSKIKKILEDVQEDIRVSNLTIKTSEENIRRIKGRIRKYEMQGIRLQYKAEIHRAYFEALSDFGGEGKNIEKDIIFRQNMIDKEHKKRAFLACERGIEIMQRKIDSAKMKIKAESQLIEQVIAYLHAMKRREQQLLELM